jgi:hypothetical protein
MGDDADRRDLDFEAIAPRTKAVEVAGRTLLVGPVVLRVWKQAADLGQQIVERLAAKYPRMETGAMTPALLVGEAMEELPGLFALLVKEKREDGSAGLLDTDWFLDNVDCVDALAIVEALMEANRWEELLGKYAALTARVRAARAGEKPSISSSTNTVGPPDSSSTT